MNDTPPEVERKYREMLLQRPGAERLKMGCSMLATARALALASAGERDPSATPASRRRTLFLRLYSSDFDVNEQGRILAHLERDDLPRCRSAAARKVAVNWDDLEVALTSRAGEVVCYLDLRSGEVAMVPSGDPDFDDVGPSRDEIEAGLEVGHLIPIEPLASSVEYRWMAIFAATVRDPRLLERLEDALHGRGAFRRFKNVLADAPGERERWFAFRDEQLRAVARAWLVEHELQATTEPRRPPR